MASTTTVAQRETPGGERKAAPVVLLQPKDTGATTSSSSSTDGASEVSMEDVFDLLPVCSVVLSPLLSIQRISHGLRNLWRLHEDDDVGRAIVAVIAEHANLPAADQARVATSLETATIHRDVQTLSGQCLVTSTVHGVSSQMAWGARIIPVYRADSLLAIILDWTQTELPIPTPAAGATSLPTSPSLVQALPPSPVAPPPPLNKKVPAHSGGFAGGISADECFRILIQSVKDYAIFLLDINGNIITWNAGAELNKGYNHEEIVGKHFSIFYSPEDIAAGKPEKELEDCLRDGRVEDEGWRIRKDGSRFWANVTMTAVYKDGVHVGYGKVTRNMTDRRAAELRVIAAYEESAKLKSDFLANMSHEIRTPMHGMLSACSLLLDTPLTADQLQIASIIDDSGQVLLRVINDILDYSKLASGSFSIHSDVIGVASIAAAVVRSLQPTLQPNVRLQLSLASDLPRAVQGDPLRFRQILMNIVGNATKFTERGCISVASSVKERNDDTFVILTKVTDTGIGVPDDAKAGLFAPFTQGDATTRKRFPGTGLGLSICKSLTELMGGEIGYEPNPDGPGSVFWFTARFLKIKSLAQLHKPDTEAQTTPHARLNRGALSPPGKQLSLFELERNSTIPPPFERIAKKTGLSKAEVASGSGFDLIEDLVENEGLSLGSPMPDDAMPEFLSDAASASLRAMTTPFSDDGPTSSSSDITPADSANESCSPTTPPSPSESLAGILSRAPPPSPPPPPPPSIMPLRPRKASVDSAVVVVDDAAEKLKRDFEASLAQLRERAPHKRLLVAEDNPTNQRVLLRILKDFHFRPDNVVVACNGAEAVAHAREHPTGFDLCLMDINMPVVDGHEATVQIRQLGIAVPVMAMTAHALQGDREQCLAYGMNDYLAKPVNKRLLVEKLLAWLPA